MDLSLFLTALSQLRAVLASFANTRGERKRQADEVTRLVLTACNETQAYLADLRDDPNKRDRKRERKLSGDWQEAGIAMRGLGDEGEKVGNRFFEKAKFWSDPTGWTQEDVDRANISLQSIEEDSKKLLKLG